MNINQPVFGDKLYFALVPFIQELYGEYRIFSASQLAGRMVETYLALDRTETFTEKYKSEIIDLVPTDIHGFNKTFDQICHEQANEIFSLSGDKQIDVYWSGGIDSTAALISLILEAKDHKQINVKLQPSSIDEYPHFYEKYVKKMNHEVLDLYFARTINLKENSAVTGEFGDQLFGSMVAVDRIEDKDNHWTTIFDNESYFDLGSGNADMALKHSKDIRYFLREKVEEQLLKSPIEIRTVFDFYWWINFTIKWQSIILRSCSYCPDFDRQQYNNLHHFFRSEDFQRWSMVNNDKKIRGDWKSYKYVVKDFIYDFTRDADYRDNKIKHNSGNPNLSIDKQVNTNSGRTELQKKNSKILAIDNNFDCIVEKHLHECRDDFQKYKVQLDENFMEWKL